jgi:hypothetical protein
MRCATSIATADLPAAVGPRITIIGRVCMRGFVRVTVISTTPAKIAETAEKGEKSALS